MAKPRILFENDSRHTLIYMFEPPIQPDQQTSAIDELLGTPVEALVYNLGYGSAFLHGTDVGERWGPEADSTAIFREGHQWNHLVFQRAYRNAKKLIDEGNDPLDLICDHAHAKGMLVYPSLQIPIPLHAKEDQALTIGAAGAVADEIANSADFSHPEVRDRRLALIEETVTQYAVDGFELNLNFYGRSHFFHPDRVEVGRAIMTDWIAEINETVKTGDAERELAVRIPSSISGCRSVGLDPVEWAREGVVDALIPENFGLTSLIDPTADFRPLVEATHKTDARVLAGLRNSVDSDRLDTANIEMIRAAACNYWEQGVDGLCLVHWTNNWPFDGAFYETLRELPHPEVMAHKDKFYLIPTPPGRFREDTKADHGLSLQLPAPLVVNEPVRFSLPISDDLTAADAVGRMHELLLRFRITRVTEEDRFIFRLNGQVLPESIMRTISQTYMLTAPRYRSHSSYWFIFRLQPDNWPVKGMNAIEVELTRRDPEATPEMRVRDVELEIKYLRGKSSFRGALYTDPDLGPYQKPLS